MSRRFRAPTILEMIIEKIKRQEREKAEQALTLKRQGKESSDTDSQDSGFHQPTLNEAISIKKEQDVQTEPSQPIGDELTMTRDVEVKLFNNKMYIKGQQPRTSGRARKATGCKICT